MIWTIAISVAAIFVVVLVALPAGGSLFRVSGGADDLTIVRELKAGPMARLVAAARPD